MFEVKILIWLFEFQDVTSADKLYRNITAVARSIELGSKLIYTRFPEDLKLGKFNFSMYLHGGSRIIFDSPLSPKDLHFNFLTLKG